MRENLINQLPELDAAMVSILASALFHAQEPIGPIPDLNALLQEAEKQAVFPIVYQELVEKQVHSPDGKWYPRYFQHLSHNLTVISQHHHAHELMTEAGIPYSVIKGCASGQYYPSPELRTMGDVDLYVKKSSMEPVRDFMTRKGYAVSMLHHSHHWTFKKDQDDFEIHWLPSGVPSADDGRIRSLFDDLLEKRVPVESEEGPLYFPDSFHHGLILLLHTANHLSAGGIGLRHLMDWLLFVWSMPEQRFCELFESILKEIGLWQFAKVLSAIGVCFFSCEPRAFCGDISSDLAKSILQDILNGGNFGVKDHGRLLESKLLRDEQTREIDGKSALRHIIRFLNRKSRLEFPTAEKYPILLPIGWVKLGLKHRRSRKSRKHETVRFHELRKSAREREQLYHQLGLFEK